MAQLKSKKSTDAKTQKTAKSSTTGKTKNWQALRDQFMLGQFDTLSDLARHCGIHPSSNFFLKKTTGWTSERDKIRQAADRMAANLMAESQALTKIRHIHADALAAHIQLFELMEALSAAAKDWTYDTPAKGLMGAKFVSEMQDAFAKILPAIQGLHQLASVNKVFDRLGAGEFDPAKASIELLKMGVALPKPLEIMLAKHKPDEDAEYEDDGQIDDAKILERRRTMLLEIEEEKKRLIPERTEFVNKLKAERKEMDSFTAEAMGKI